jgi:hypothetical protein
MDYVNFYKSYCKKIDSFTFKSVVKSVVGFIVDDDKCSADNKMLFADWLSSKLYNYYQLPRRDKEEIKQILESKIYSIKSAPILALYLYFMDRALSIDLCNHVYFERLNDNFFINQMMNDSILLKHYRYTLEGEQYLNHFIEWINKTGDDVQRSNLLDVLLSDHGNDKRVSKIFSEMKGGESLFENKQNVHSDEIAIPVKSACVELLKWNAENPNFISISEEDFSEVDRGKWVESFLAGSNIDKTLIAGILQRTMIDRQPYELVDDETATIFDVLYAVCNYISRHKDKDSLLQILGEEFAAAIELCGSGYIARFISVLQGFDTRFQIKVNFFACLYAKINNIIMEKIKFEPGDSDVILGTYDEKYRECYFKFIIKSINMRQLYEQYGEQDVKREICNVLNKITSTDVWFLEGDLLMARQFIN